MRNKSKQVDWVADYLRLHGRITQREFDTFYGANGDSSLSARIGELRGAGWVISKVEDEYFLVSEPSQPHQLPLINAVQVPRPDLEKIQMHLADLQLMLFDILTN